MAPIGLGAAQLGSSGYDHAKDIFFKALDLEVNYFDNYHLHALANLDDVDVRLGGPLEALVEAREVGKIRHIGVTGHTFPSVLVAALKRFKFDTFLVPLNIVEREPLAELIPLALEMKLGVTIMKPIATGLLPASLALKWLMNQPISVAVPGATTVAEMEQNAMLGALDDHTLTTAEEAEVAKWALDLATDRCRICMECLPCPSNIEIPGTLGTDVMYNHYRTIGPAKFAEFPWEKSRVDDA